MNNLLKRLLDLSKRTGDRIVFADMDGKEAHVVLPLADYERLVGGEARSSLPKADVPQSQNQEPSTMNPRSSIVHNPVEEMNREIVRSLEAERSRSEASRPAIFSGKESDLEIEERYYLEPIE